MLKRTTLLGLVVVGLAILWDTAVRADYTTALQSFTIPLTATNWDPSTTVLTGVDPVDVVKFDPNSSSLVQQAGATANLTEVDLTLNYTFENTMSMVFYNPSQITISGSGTMNLYGPDGKTNLVAPASFSSSATQTATASDTFSKYVKLPTQTFSGSASQAYVDQATLSEFLYNGTSPNDRIIILPVYAQAQTSFTTSGSGGGSSLTLAGATITVVYHYMLSGPFVIPEPSSLTLTALGVMGLGVIVAMRSRVGLKKSGAI